MPYIQIKLYMHVDKCVHTDKREKETVEENNNNKGKVGVGAVDRSCKPWNAVKANGQTESSDESRKTTAM